MRAPDYLAVAEPLMCVTAQCEWPMHGQQDFSDFQQPVRIIQYSESGKDVFVCRCDSDPDWFRFFLFLSRSVESILTLCLICHRRLNT